MAAARPRRKVPVKPALRMSALLGLQKVDLFKGLDSYTLREIAAQCKWTRCKRNQVVIQRDGTDRDVYFVIAGQVRVTALAGRGRRIIFRDVAAGEVFGEHSAIDGRSALRRRGRRCASRCSRRCRRRRSAPSSPTTPRCASACCAA